MLSEQLRDNISYLKDIAYVEFTADVTITSTVEATPTDVVSAGAITFAATPIEISFFTSALETAAATSASVVVNLWDGATNLGRIGQITTSAAAVSRAPMNVVTRLTPTAGSHTYKITAYQANGNGLVRGGTGGSGNYRPGYIRIRGIPS